MVESLAVVILTFNEEKNLPDCLASLKGLDADIFVVDSGSTDATLQIAKAAGAHVAQHPFENYGAQRNWAIRTLPIRTPWELHLDADERLTPALVDEIRALLEAAPADIDGYMLRKRTIFMGRWIKHGGHYPSHHLRLFRRGKGRCEDRLYDQHFIVDGPITTLRNDYLDILTSDLATFTARHNRWSELEAREMMALDEPPGPTSGRVEGAARGHAIQRKRWQRESVYGRSPLFLRAFLYFGYRYFLRLGFLDGKEGLIFHFLQGCWFRFLVDARIHEIRQREGA